MRLAIISDVHGNIEALQQVLEDIDSSRVDDVICLGDNVGYGPDSELVIQQIQARNIPSVLGNHELAVNDEEYLNWFNPTARKSLVKTRDMLSEASLNFIAKLKPYLKSHGCRFVHGFPPDSPLIYIFQVSDNLIKQAFEAMEERRCFIGHTHILEIIGYQEDQLFHDDLPIGLTTLQAEKKYIINIGSVGQPRDADNTAKYVIWDSSAETIEVRSVPYDIAAVIRKIEFAGLPQEHGQRLW